MRKDNQAQREQLAFLDSATRERKVCQGCLGNKVVQVSLVSLDSRAMLARLACQV